MRTKTPVQFGPYRFDPINACVWRGNKALSLRPKAFAVLQYLLDHAGQLVTKNELLEAVWPDVYVTEGALKGCIQEIRTTLGDKAGKPQFIETVHRRGYRFIVTVSPSAVPQSSSRILQPKSGRARVPRTDAPPLSQSPQLFGHHLVGRDTELSELQGWLDKALGGTRQMIFITGEAGIGKTALLETFLGRIPAWWSC